MKKALLILALGLVTASGAFAQGEIVFANFNSGVNSPITDTTGARLNAGAGANGFYADLFYGAPGSTDAQLTDLGIAVPFSTGGGAGYFLGGGPHCLVSQETRNSKCASGRFRLVQHGRQLRVVVLVLFQPTKDMAVRSGVFLCRSR